MEKLASISLILCYLVLSVHHAPWLADSGLRPIQTQTEKCFLSARAARTHHCVVTGRSWSLWLTHFLGKTILFVVSDKYSVIGQKFEAFIVTILINGAGRGIYEDFSQILHLIMKCHGQRKIVLIFATLITENIFLCSCWILRGL